MAAADQSRSRERDHIGGTWTSRILYGRGRRVPKPTFSRFQPLCLENVTPFSSQPSQACDYVVMYRYYRSSVRRPAGARSRSVFLRSAKATPPCWWRGWSDVAIVADRAGVELRWTRRTGCAPSWPRRSCGRRAGSLLASQPGVDRTLASQVPWRALELLFGHVLGLLGEGAALSPVDGLVRAASSRRAPPARGAHPRRSARRRVQVHPFANLAAVSRDADRVDVLFVGKDDGITEWRLRHLFHFACEPAQARYHVVAVGRE